MELRNPLASRWDFDRYNRERGWGSPFPDGISFADVDIEIEINSHFLVIEGKRPEDVLSKGQRRAMLARRNDGRTCIVVVGDPDTGEVVAIQTFSPERTCPATLREVWQYCHDWANWARTQPRPSERLELCFIQEKA
jgi:hypothetical protein